MTTEQTSAGNRPTQFGNKTNPNLLWVAGALVALLLVGCMATFLVGIWWMNVSSGKAQIEPAQPAAARLQVVVEPTPRVIVATPETGIDYVSAVLANIYEKVNPSVVNVTVLGREGSALPSDLQVPGLTPQDFVPVSSGSGFVWDTDGHIVTNNHVVEGADQVQVTFSDGAIGIADVVGTDKDSDLAVLHIDPAGFNLVPIKPGKLEEVRVGMRVAAIGNPFGLEGTLTSGIVSAIGRSIPARENFSIPDSIQTDAAINPGNSGGPLLNERGELIGINAQIRSDVRSNSGVGFAIPVNVVVRAVPALIAAGKYEHSYIGISGSTFSPLCADDLSLPKTMRGALVDSVLPNTPASAAGLHGGGRASGTHYPSICPDKAGGDLIVAINDQPVTKFDDVLAYLQRYTSPGDQITLTVWRNGKKTPVDVTLAARPSATSQQQQP